MDGIGKRHEARGADNAYPLPPRLAAILECLPLDRLAFTPVPVQARRDGWSPARQTGFIHRMALCGDVGSSARGVGMSRESAWRLRKRAGAGSFAAAWDLAASWGGKRMNDLGIERCLEGEVRPYYYRGSKCGESVRHDNRLLIALLNRRPPRWPSIENPAVAPAAQPALKANDFSRDSE